MASIGRGWIEESILSFCIFFLQLLTLTIRGGDHMKSRSFAFLLVTVLFIPIITGCGSQAASAQITATEAESIALEHAGFRSEEITQIYTEYDGDDRLPKYEVQFYQDAWEYEYDINAETGEILSYSQDDRY